MIPIVQLKSLGEVLIILANDLLFSNKSTKRGFEFSISRPSKVSQESLTNPKSRNPYENAFTRSKTINAKRDSKEAAEDR